MDPSQSSSDDQNIPGNPPQTYPARNQNHAYQTPGPPSSAPPPSQFIRRQPYSATLFPTPTVPLAAILPPSQNNSHSSGATDESIPISTPTPNIPNIRLFLHLIHVV